nr:ABC transporter ATP-binding protein [Bacillus sp. 165]
MSKSYKNKEVVANINMNIKKGEIYSFLGPNGAGKTTVMKMLTGLVKPTSGSIEIFGEPLLTTSYEVFKRIGSIIEYPIFYNHLTAQENLDVHCKYMGYYDKKAIDEALELVQLKQIDNKPVQEFSLGMKQRLGIARAVCTRPELLILDEPINGMDPIGIHELRELFRVLSKEYGMTLLISSHILQEVEQIADTIGVINQGKLIEEVSMESIHSKYSEYIEVVTTNGKQAAFILEEKLCIVNYKMVDVNAIRIYEPHVSPVDIAKTLIMHDVGIEALNKKNVSLEEHFLALIQGGGVHD